MRIRSVETFSVGLPFKERYVTSAGSLERREMAILRLRSERGLAGHGDAVPLSLRGGPSLAAVVADLEGPCRAVLEGAAVDVATGSEHVLAACESSGAGPQAIAAVDAALLDLLGRELDCPAWELLGVEGSRPVRCNGTIGADDPRDAARRAAALTEAGFGTIKVKVGTEGDRERMEAVRSGAGDGPRLRVDANGAWSVARARESLAALSDLDLELAEQPCGSAEATAELRTRGGIPLVLDESVATTADADRARRIGACDAVTLKLAKVGGVHAALTIADRIPSYLSSALDSPLGIAAAAHAAQALPMRGFAAGLAHGLSTSSLFADNVADDRDLLGPEIAPAGPGLGVEIDDDALSRLALA